MYDYILFLYVYFEHVQFAGRMGDVAPSSRPPRANFTPRLTDHTAHVPCVWVFVFWERERQDMNSEILRSWDGGMAARWGETCGILGPRTTAVSRLSCCSVVA